MPNEKYEVGYSKPPQNTRFQKGQSGNPSGRPKGSKNIRKPFMTSDLNDIIFKEFNTPIIAHINGNQVEISKIEAIMSQLANQGASGDLKAINKSIEIMKFLTKADDRENGLLYSHYMEISNQNRKEIAKRAGCDLEAARKDRFWKIHEELSIRDSYRKIFGEEKCSYFEGEPKSKKDWKRLDLILYDALSGKNPFFN